MKFNKVSDLSSISVLPPHTRKSNTVPSGLQGPRLRSQPSGQSQQSFSHGLSSQNAWLSQFSQNSLDEAVTNDQRLSSQERENSVKRLSCLPALTYGRDESQPPNSRSSGNLMCKWNSVDLKGQLSEGLEHRIGIMETSLSRFAMILDSIQNDVMQVNKGTKEVTLEMEQMRQKLIAQDSTLQLLTKGQEEIKTSIDGSLKSLSDQVSKVTSQDKLQETFLVVSTLPQLIEASLQNLQTELLNNFSKEMQVVSCSLKGLNKKDLAPATILTKSIGSPVTIPKKPQVPARAKKKMTTSTQFLGPSSICPRVFKLLYAARVVIRELTWGEWKLISILLDLGDVKISVQATKAPELGNEGWKSVKKVAFSDRLFDKEHEQNGPCSEKRIKAERDRRIITVSDEETDGSFSCVTQKCTDLYGNWTKEAKEESERILREARRRKRKHCNTIIIN